MLDHSTLSQALPPQKLYPPFQISTSQTPPFSKSPRVIRPPPMTLKGRYIGEPAFSEVVEDASDIPVDVVKRHIASGSVDDGFLVAVDGCLLRTSAEDVVEFDQEEGNQRLSRLSNLFGKGRRMNTTGSDVNDRS
ncbi:hypothetical protein BYT27DRAFT_6852895 [Phlegmacium glaucopus]|nr:hypothetical protein BYT27DRAFT_6852895 [Phlegmacium glaucopus]